MAKKEKSLTSMCCAAAIFAVLAAGYSSSSVMSGSTDKYAAASIVSCLQKMNYDAADNADNTNAIAEEQEK